MRIRSFVAWIPRGSTRRIEASAPPGEGPDGWRCWRGGSLTVWYAPRDAGASQLADALGHGIILGDDSEWKPTAPLATLAGGVPLRYEPGAKELVVRTSIVALPPVYLYEGAGAVAMTSDIALLTGLPGVRLELDARGVTELGWYGHPVERRTLFEHVTLVKAGVHLALQADGTVAMRQAWRMPELEPLSPDDFIDAQIAAFTRAVQATDVSRSFLSLTAGLDTRTVFAALAAAGRAVPGVTLTGHQASLDARTAERLCRAYALPHQSVVIDGAFQRALPSLVERANRLSGGLSSVGQAPEVFLYDKAGAGYTARLSGNLGNQVGRGGTEGVSTRGADLGIIAPHLRVALEPSSHWLLNKLGQHAPSALEFILQNEIAVSSVGNYSVGNHFATQQSPYASRALIEVLARRPSAGGPAPSGSKLRMRLRDLRHRFVGEPERVSFQRTLVKRIGGAAARIPINWGWRPAGGVSPAGLILGVATMAGMIARAKGLDDGTLGGIMRRTGLPALHDFRESRRWLREPLRPFVLDTLHDPAVAQSGIFDSRHLGTVLDEHFQGKRDHYETVTFALDLALARRLGGR